MGDQNGPQRFNVSKVIIIVPFRSIRNSSSTLTQRSIVSFQVLGVSALNIIIQNFACIDRTLIADLLSTTMKHGATLGFGFIVHESHLDNFLNKH